MSDEERAKRIEIVYQHHIAYGIRIEDDDQRARIYLNDTAAIPFDLFRKACKWARQCHAGAFPPTQGHVIAAAREIEWERDPDRYRTPGQAKPADPKWYRRMRAGQAPVYAVK